MNLPENNPTDQACMQWRAILQLTLLDNNERGLEDIRSCRVDPISSQGRGSAYDCLCSMELIRCVTWTIRLEKFARMYGGAKVSHRM